MLRNVVLIGAGPLGATLKAPDRETLDAYRVAAGLAVNP